MSALVPSSLVHEAAQRLTGVARRTALRRSESLSRIAGGDVYLKLECEQLTGSFKLRGAFNALSSIPEADRPRGVVASSAGNHGMGVAWAARHFGIPATIFVPSSAPAVKREGIARLGARVDTSCPDYDAAHAAALAMAAREGARFVNPCAGEALIAGQGTVAVEILDQLPEARAIVVPVGGGGLVGGIASWVRATAPRVRIFGAQSERTDAMARSLAAGRIVDIGHEPTLADGLAGGIDEEGLAVGRAALDVIVRVPEAEIARAIAWLAEEEQLTVEGSGAVGVAALRGGLLPDLPTPAALVLSGGNIDPAVLAAVRRQR
ncbi:MAG TPA: threonine/serine dehydratase [Gemmatimonadaceae bacterium]|nr:threonine/serine dehydratase [Gemmatimonadaceae bacterium]